MDTGISIPVNADIAKLESKMLEAESRLKNFENAIDAVNKTMGQKWNQMAAGVAVYTTALKNVASAVQSYIIAPLSGAVNAFVSFGDQLAKTSQRVGIGVEALGGIKFAAEQCGAGFDEAVDAIKTFQEQLGAAKLGDAGAIGKLGAVGIDAADFEGLSNEEQFLKLADHIQAIGDRAQQTRTAIELFGDAGFKLLPFFQEGSEGIRKLMEEGKSIGAVLGEDAANSAAALGDSMNRMKTSCANVSNLLMSNLAPAVTAVMNGISGVVSGLNSFYSAHRSFVNALAETAGVAVPLFAALANGKLIVAGLTAAFGTLKTAMLSISPTAVVLTGIAAGLLYWKDSADKAREAQYALSSEQEKNLKLLQEQQTADQKRMERLKELQELSDKDMLRNSEVEEANRLTEELAENYGDLGVRIDEASGKISGMTEAQKKLNEEMNRARANALESWLKEAKANNDRRTKNADDLEKRWSGWNTDWTITSYMFGGKEADLEKAAGLREDSADRTLRISEAEAELKRLRGEKSAEQPPETKTTADLTAANRHVISPPECRLTELLSATGETGESFAETPSKNLRNTFLKDTLFDSSKIPAERLFAIRGGSTLKITEIYAFFSLLPHSNVKITSRITSR